MIYKNNREMYENIGETVIKEFLAMPIKEFCTNDRNKNLLFSMFTAFEEAMEFDTSQAVESLNVNELLGLILAVERLGIPNAVDERYDLCKVLAILMEDCKSLHTINLYLGMPLECVNKSLLALESGKQSDSNISDSSISDSSISLRKEAIESSMAEIETLIDDRPVSEITMSDLLSSFLRKANKPYWPTTSIRRYRQEIINYFRIAGNFLCNNIYNASIANGEMSPEQIIQYCDLDDQF